MTSPCGSFISFQPKLRPKTEKNDVMSEMASLLVGQLVNWSINNNVALTVHTSDWTAPYSVASLAGVLFIASGLGFAGQI